MTSLATGGGSSAVAASTHAACERFRRTDPLITKRSRRALAQELGHPDTTAGIPEARWMRAMTFERLVESDDFVSPLLTTAVGAAGLPRPSSVRRFDAKVSLSATATALAQAHLKAVHDDVSTMITGLAVPYVGFEEDTSTPVKPDFAIVVPRHNEGDPRGRAVGSWLIVGDAKDYERVRSRISDARMLKGFLQVALGAESLAAWSKRPRGMEVHRSGALAVPKNSFLQPVAVVEQLDDHRSEVRARAEERKAQLEALPEEGIDARQIEHITAVFDPATCPSCSLFNFCRHQLRSSSDPGDVLVEIGIPQRARPGLLPALKDEDVDSRVPRHLLHRVQATVTGTALRTGQRRVDQAGRPGTLNVVLAKSDAAALGVHGVGWRRHGQERWTFATFQDPQAPSTRRRLMALMGEQLDLLMAEMASRNPDAPSPIHVVLPDGPTGDVLVSIADSLAGVELSRLRWERDVEQGRPPLTFDGADATIPEALSPHERLAVSFLLEEDRARAMRLRCPLIDLREVLASHVVPGGPWFEAGRLDYLVCWATAAGADHREISDEISNSPHTAGARLANKTSDEIHAALRRVRQGREAPVAVEALVTRELAYKGQILDSALSILEGIEDSLLREARRAIEGDAQEVWRRRLGMHASDLVRFGRVYRWWRDRQVDMLDSDGRCGDVLRHLSNPDLARDGAVDAGKRDLSRATVESVSPLILRIEGQSIRDGDRVVMVAHNGVSAIDHDDVALMIQGGSFKLSGIVAGSLEEQDDVWLYEWAPKNMATFEVSDEVVLGKGEWLNLGKYNKDISVPRPQADQHSAPKASCEEGNYADDPAAHAYCCRSHEISEAVWSDTLAERRARGELNPQVWPPVIDIDGFDVVGDDETAVDQLPDATDGGREALTMDDLD